MMSCALRFCDMDDMLLHLIAREVRYIATWAVPLERSTA
jgi:hypothetical protein